MTNAEYQEILKQYPDDYTIEFVQGLSIESPDNFFIRGYELVRKVVIAIIRFD